MSERTSRSSKAGITVVGVLLGVTVIGGSVIGQGAVARNLDAKSTQALQAAGVSGVDVSFSGREATLAGAADEMSQAKTAVEGVNGVRWARTQNVEAASPALTPSPASPSAVSTPVTPAAPLAIDISDQGGQYTATGTVASQADADQLTTAAGQVLGGTVSSNLTVDPSATMPSWWSGLPTALATFPKVDAGSLAISDQGLTITGAVPDSVTYNAMRSAAQGASFAVDNKVTVDPAFQVAANPAGGVALTGQVASQDDADALTAAVGGAFGTPVDSKLQVVPECAGSTWYGSVASALQSFPAVSGGTLSASVTGMQLGGTVASDADQATLSGALSSVPIATDNQVTVAAPATQLSAADIATINGTVIPFATSSYQLDAAAKARLNAVIPLLKASTAHVEIQGFVSLPQNGDPVAASKQRAQAVANYLTAAGIDPARLTVTGRGAANPVASNGTATGRAANQRATLTIKES